MARKRKVYDVAWVQHQEAQRAKPPRFSNKRKCWSRTTLHCEAEMTWINVHQPLETVGEVWEHQHHADLPEYRRCLIRCRYCKREMRESQI